MIRNMVLKRIGSALLALLLSSVVIFLLVRLAPDVYKRQVEINPRTAGNYIVELIEYVTGVNMLKAFVSLALGQQPSVTVSDTNVSSAAIMFIVPDCGGKIRQIKGADTLREDSNIIRYRIEDCVGKSIEKPIDNACYLGHVITRDCDGYGARMFAETALRRLEIEFEETERVHEAI